MQASVESLDRRRFLELAAATAVASGLAKVVHAAEHPVPPLRLPLSQTVTLPASAVRVVVDQLSGPEGPTVLADGRIAFIARPGKVIVTTPQGQSEVFASDQGLIVGTAVGAHHENALYVCKMDPTRIPRLAMAPGPSAPGAAGSGGPSPGGAPPAAAMRALSGGKAAPGAAILKLDLATRQIAPLYTHCDGRPLGGPNKMAADSWGDLWITDVFDGALYWARTDGSAIHRMVSPLPGAHGITLSPDRRTVFVSSEERMVAFDIIGRGQLAMQGDQPRSRTVVEFAANSRVDGIRTEASGNLVLACSDKGLIVLSALGRALSQTVIQGLGISNLVFGGKGERTVYATANEGTGEAGGGSVQGVGKLVAFDWPRAGLRAI